MLSGHKVIVHPIWFSAKFYKTRDAPMQHQRRPVATYRHFFFTAYTLRNKVEIKVQYR